MVLRNEFSCGASLKQVVLVMARRTLGPSLPVIKHINL